jgi:hypothetical protein
MEQKNHLWNLSQEGGFSFTLSGVKASNYSVIKWRSLVFNISVHRSSGQTGWPSFTGYHISAKRKYSFSKKVLTGSSVEIFQDSIIVQEYYLHIYISGNTLRLTEYDTYQRTQSKMAFKIILCQDYKPSKIVLPVKSLLDLYSVKLFEDRNQHQITVTEASYKDGKLMVEHWQMGHSSYYEDEDFIEIKDEDLFKLSALLHVKENYKRVLLRKIRLRFNGKNAFKEFRAFIEQNKIPFNSGVRHD